MAYPHPRTTHQFNSSSFLSACALPQHPTALHRNKQAGGEASSLASGPSAHFPQLVGAPEDLWPHGPRCRHQGHPAEEGFPALPTKAGWTVAGVGRRKEEEEGWQFPPCLLLSLLCGRRLGAAGTWSLSVKMAACCL